MTKAPLQKAGPSAPVVVPLRAARMSAEQELDALYERPGFMLRRAHQIAVSLFMEETGERGITTTQFGAMVLLRARPAIDQATLARLMGFDRSTTGLVVGKLEAAGYVTRVEDGDDRRRKTLRLSAAGRAALRGLRAPAGRASTRLLDPFNPAERRQFLALLGRLVATYDGVVRTPLRRD